jgi:hypothetical protein
MQWLLTTLARMQYVLCMQIVFTNQFDSPSHIHSLKHTMNQGSNTRSILNEVYQTRVTPTPTPSSTPIPSTPSPTPAPVAKSKTLTPKNKCNRSCGTDHQVKNTYTRSTGSSYSSPPLPRSYSPLSMEDDYNTLMEEDGDIMYRLQYLVI